MKKIAIFVGVVVALLGVAVVAVPALVPAERVKAELAAQVKAATGRDLTIDGKVAVSVLPTLSVQVSGVALSNPAGYRTKEMARLGGLDVRLKLLPLLSGRIEIDSFVVRQPAITLEVDGAGRGNWQFGAAAPAKADAKPVAKAEANTEKSAPGDIRLGDVRIIGGTLVYLDGKGGAGETFESIDLTLTLTSLDQPLSAKGGLKWHGQTVALALDVAKPRALLEGKASAAGVSIAADSLKLGFTGELAGGASGLLEVTSPSVRALAGWAGGKPLAFAGSGLGPLSLRARVTAGGGAVALTQAVISLDAIKAAGELSLVTGGVRPALKGRLDVETLDFGPYLPPEGKGAAESKGAAEGGKPAAAGGRSDWSDETIDASALKALDADFTLSANAIRLRRLEIGKSALSLALRDGRLTADLTELTLYQGKAKGKVTLDGAQAGLGLNAAVSLKGLQAAPFLTVFGFDRLEGTGSAELQLTGRGATQRQIVSSLGGKGDVRFVDGAIRGINLAAMARNLTTGFTDTSGTQKTDFAELSGTFSIAGGVATNSDLSLKSPLLRVAGAGRVDLPRRSLNYRIEPKLSATLQGQGGALDAAGIEVAVLVEGPWDGLSFRPDLAGMARGAAGNAVRDALRSQGLPNLPFNPGKLFGN